MDFKEQPVESGGHACPRQQFDELRLAAACAARRAGLLQAMRDVEHDRIAQRAHLGRRPEVYHQVAVAEAGAALGQEDPAIAAGGDLVGGVLHVFGCHELALLDVDDATGATGRYQQVRLTTQEGGDLKNVARLGHRCRLTGLVDVSEHGQAGLLADITQDLKALFQAKPAIRRLAGPVSLVEGSLEYRVQSRRVGRFRQCVTDLEGMLGGFNDARAADHEQPAPGEKVCGPIVHCVALRSRTRNPAWARNLQTTLHTSRPTLPNTIGLAPDPAA